MKKISLSVVIPVHNMASWIPHTVEAIRIATDLSEFKLDQIIVVDDGSSEHDESMLRDQALLLDFDLVRQRNEGRFLARKQGLQDVVSDYVLLIDARVRIEPNSLAFAFDEIEKKGQTCFTGHIQVSPDSRIIGYFWSAIEYMAWQRYSKSPRKSVITGENFDDYPKGTTCFLAPREWLTEAINGFNSIYKDLKDVNDDTALLLPIAQKYTIQIDPGYSAIYNPRQKVIAFCRHAFHRGIVFLDAHAKKGQKWRFPLIFVFALIPFAFCLAFFMPKIFISIVLLLPLLLATFLASLGGGFRRCVALVLYFYPFTSSYFLGICTGLTKILSGKIGTAKV
jgi:glycosyltransferase involved in cell wall biosynthesis